MSASAVAFLVIGLGLGPGLAEAQTAKPKASKARTKTDRSKKTSRRLNGKRPKKRSRATTQADPFNRKKAKRQLKRMETLRVRIGLKGSNQGKLPKRLARLGRTDKMALLNALRDLEKELRKQVPGRTVHRGLSGENIMNEIAATLHTMAQIEAAARNQSGMVGTAEAIHAANQTTPNNDLRVFLADLLFDILSGGETAAEAQARIEAQAKFLAERQKKRDEKAAKRKKKKTRKKKSKSKLCHDCGWIDFFSSDPSQSDLASLIIRVAGQDVAGPTLLELVGQLQNTYYEL